MCYSIQLRHKVHVLVFIEDRSRNRLLFETSTNVLARNPTRYAIPFLSPVETEIDDLQCT